MTIESIERRLHLDASQLTEAIISSTLPASVSDESVIKGSLVLNVANNSGVTQKFKGTVEVLINNQVLTSKGGLISLPAGQSKLVKLAVNVRKGKVADGSYDLTGEVLQSGGIFSQSPVAGTLEVHPPIVALSEAEVFHKLPVTVAPGVKFNTSDLVSIANSGSDPSADPILIDVFASTNGQITGAVLLASVKKKLTIAAGRTAAVAIPIHDKTGLPAGSYQLISAVTQTNGTVSTTNAATAPVLSVPAPVTVPEFVDTVLTATPLYTNQSSGAQTLSQIDVQMFIENNGISSNGASQFALFVSTSPTFDSSATEIESLPLTQFIPGHGSGNGFQVDFGIPQPSPVQFNGSSYYIFVQVTDPNGAVTVGADATPVVIS